MRAFFHVRNFIKKDPSEPGPILGERVSLLLSEGSRGPFATLVERENPPEMLTGRVRSFDPIKGWGFVEAGDSVFFLHRSDFAESWFPSIGKVVSFYRGEGKGKSRACWAQPL